MIHAGRMVWDAVLRIHTLFFLTYKHTIGIVVQDRYWCEKGVYHFLLALQCLYGRSHEEGENGGGKEGR